MSPGIRASRSGTSRAQSTGTWSFRNRIVYVHVPYVLTQEHCELQQPSQAPHVPFFGSSRSETRHGPPAVDCAVTYAEPT
jgi:hypothetical protein